MTKVILFLSVIILSGLLLSSLSLKNASADGEMEIQQIVSLLTVTVVEGFDSKPGSGCELVPDEKIDKEFDDFKIKAEVKGLKICRGMDGTVTFSIEKAKLTAENAAGKQIKAQVKGLSVKTQTHGRVSFISISIDEAEVEFENDADQQVRTKVKNFHKEIRCDPVPNCVEIQQEAA